jgi:hypothetical protein
MAALLALWWFASRPIRCGLHSGLHHHLLISRGHHTGIGSYPQVIGYLAARGAYGHDPELYGRGLR